MEHGRMSKVELVTAILPLLLILSSTMVGSATTGGRTRGLVQPTLSPPSLQYLNSYFRYSSVNFVGNGTSRQWDVLPSVDWRNSSSGNVVGDPIDQGSCGSCWALSAVGALESAYALAYNVTKPNISSQQVLDCEGSGSVSSNCIGGLPIDAFNYIATLKLKGTGLLNGTFYPYKGWRSYPPRCYEKYMGTYGITMYETTDFFGWFGLLLTLQSQPVVVLIQADDSSFVNFQGSGIYDNPSCYSSIVNHAVLLVGYNLTNNVPYWIIKNSWGSSWGDKGFAKIAIRGGEGICGIQSNPGMYPVVAGAPPCSGKVNPCGGGLCIPNFSNKTYKCSCPSGFVAVKSIDKTETCAPIDACGFSTYNPCNFGTCLNNMVGGYSCICPFGYAEGQMADGRTTCVPVKYSNKYFVVKNRASCLQILAQFRLTPEKFRMLNQGQDCNSFRSGSVLNVSTDSTCSIYYSSRKNYSCSSVLKLFQLTSNQFSFLNPSVNCSQPISSFVQVCVKTGIPANYTAGNQTYAVKSGDTCQSIIRSFNLTATQFFTLNPGVYCDGLIPKTNYNTPGQLVYISGTVGSTTCKYKTYVVVKGDTCARLIYLYFSNSITVFKKYNNNAACTSTWLYVGRSICRP